MFIFKNWDLDEHIYNRGKIYAVCHKKNDGFFFNEDVYNNNVSAI